MGGNMRQKVERMNARTYHKAYKSGKTWIFASISSLAVGLGLFWGSTVTGYAATIATTDSATTASTPTADSTSASSVAQTTETDNLKTDFSQLQTAVDTAKSTGVAVTENQPKTVTTTPDQLADTVSDVKTDYDQQAQDLATATTKQEANNVDYATQKADYDNNVVTIKSTNTEWTDADLVKLLAGNGDETDVTGSTTYTDADKLAASDQAKQADEIKIDQNTTVTDQNGDPITNTMLNNGAKVSTTKLSLDNGNQPSWTYHNAFIDRKNGRSVDVVLTVTGYKLAKGHTNDEVAVEAITNYIGFQPFFVENVTAKLSYFYSDTGEPATIDAVVGMSDLDGNQGVTINNGFKTLIKGSAISNVDGVYRDTKSSTFSDTNPQGQVWVLQKGVSETDYTFYVGLNSDGTVNNTEPLQYIGGASFSTTVPSAPILTTEKASYTPTIVQVQTNYTIHYQGAGSETPNDITTPVTWTGDYDASSDTYTWTPSQSSVTAVTSDIAGYEASSETAGWTLAANTSDPANQDLTVIYHAAPTVSDKTVLTTRYVDEKGNDLSNAATQTGTIGDSFEVHALTIDGYTLIGNATATGTYQGNAMTLTFTYGKNGQVADNTASKLVVHYVDSTGQPIADPTSQSGIVGEAFTVQAKAITGYTVIGKNTVTDTYRGNLTMITFTYAKEGQVSDNTASQLIVHYVDKDGNVLANPTSQSGTIGDSFETQAKTIDGYTVIGQSKVAGNYTGNLMALTFTYTKTGQTADNTHTTLVTHYTDADGNVLADPTSQSGTIGDSFETQAKTIDEYTVIGKRVVSGTYKGNAMAVTFTYDKNGQVANNTTTTLLIQYVDKNGKSLSATTQQSGKIGSPFTASAIDIPGYTVSGKASVTGTYQGNQMILTFVYDKTTTTDVTPPDTPETGTTPSTDTQPETPVSETPKSALVPSPPTSVISKRPETSTTHGGKTDANSTTHLNAQSITTDGTSADNVAAKKLPQTDERHTNESSVIGLSLLSALALFGLARKRRD